MPLTDSGIKLNFKSLTVTYGASPTVVSIPDVTQVMHPRKGKAIHLYGDANRFKRIVNTVEQERAITIKSNALTAMEGIPVDTPCTITWLEGDAVNKFAAGGGGYTYTVVNAVLHENPYTMDNNKHGDGGLTFECYMNTSDTDPVSKAAL